MMYVLVSKYITCCRSPSSSEAVHHSPVSSRGERDPGDLSAVQRKCRPVLRGGCLCLWLGDCGAAADSEGEGGRFSDWGLSPAARLSGDTVCGDWEGTTAGEQSSALVAMDYEP